MEEDGKKFTPAQQKYRIPKKESNKQSADVHIQSPLSRIADVNQWDNPLQRWASSPRKKICPLSWNRKRRSEKCCIDNETPAFGRQPKVILTNVLKTEMGRKYIKTQLKTEANLSHGVKLQSDQQTSPSVDTVDIWQIFRPLQQSLFISERKPKIILTNVLTTNTGRKYIQKSLLTDVNISDASVLQSDRQTPSPDACLESCSKISCPPSCIVPKRCGKFQIKTSARKQSNDGESNDFLMLRTCDVILEDCSKKNRERDHPEKGRNDSKNPSSGLREASFQNSERQKRREEAFASQQNFYSSEKSPFLSREQRTEQIQPFGCTDSNENHQSYTHNPQQENTPQPLETGHSETSTNISEDPSFICSDKTKSVPKRKQNSASNKDEQNALLASPADKQVNTTASGKGPLNRPRGNKEINDSAEPIVLSSDEEADPDSKGRRRYIKIGRKKTKLKSIQSLSEEPTQDTIENQTKLVSPEKPKFHTSEHCSTSNEEEDPVLDIPFEALYIGKYKGKATGCAAFTTDNIRIPVEVSLPGNFKKKMELLVDSKHLRKYGLWTNNSSLKSDAVIFLWLSSDYVEQIEKEIGTSILNKQAKNAEFIFILLPQPLAEAEQIVMDKILVEISKRNSSPELSEYLLWEQVIPLLQGTSCEESSFLASCHESFQKLLQEATTSVLAACTSQVHQSLSGEPKSKSSPIKPNYTLLVKRNSGEYSFTITSAQRNEWKEVQEAGPARTLIFYPPPPAKGGLGVTREDLECLEYGEFLNDVIIDFYLKEEAKNINELGEAHVSVDFVEEWSYLPVYLLLEKAPKEIADRSYIFSSFFYKCLTRIENNVEENPNLSIAQKRHEGVRRWTRHINIFTKDYIFVPVNEESHWYIAIICFPWLEEIIYEDCSNQDSLPAHSKEPPRQLANKKNVVKTETVLVFNDTQSDKGELERNSNLQSKEHVQQTTVSPGQDPKMLKKSSSASKIKKLCKRSCIIILDSLRSSSVQNTVQVLREYLEAEWEAKYKTHRQFNKSTMVNFCPRVPKQDNNSDCGVYLLQYVETFFQDPIVNFELPMHLEQWFPRHVVQSKREEIRELILQLHLQQQSGSTS